MKIFYFLLNLIILSHQLSILAQTYADPPGPENVLVVYRADHTYSGLIKNHYVEVREIPSTNVIDVTLDETIQYSVSIEDDNERIVGEGILPWNYVKVKIADVIEDHLNTTYYNGQLLKDMIRYIVLCKGIPHRIDDTDCDDLNQLWRGDVTIDALLCLLNQGNGTDFLDLYGSYAMNSNPYFSVDPTYTMDYRFLSNYFEKGGWKLQYLISRLDGDNYQDVIGMINRGFNPDIAGDKWWILDHCDTCIGSGHVSNTFNSMDRIGGFNTNYDGNSPFVNQWITSNEEGNVIGYVSHGVHSGMPEDYILNTLVFNYDSGAVFNSVESYNGAYFGYSRVGQGLISDFIHMLGTAGGANAWEPTTGNVYNSWISFPAYGLGYNLVDAVWMGYSNIAYRNVVVGDPLTKIYDCQPTIISNNTTLGPGDYNCDIIVEENATLTIDAGAIVNFNRNANVKVYGTLEISDGATVNFNAYSSLELEENLTITGSTAFMNFNQKSLFEAKDISVDNHFVITFNDYSKLYIKEGGTFTTHSNNLFVFNNNSMLFSLGKVVVNEGNTMIFNNSSKFNVEYKTLFNAGAVVNFNDDSHFSSRGTVKMNGTSTNNVVFNFPISTKNKFTIHNGDTLLIDFVTFNHNGLQIAYEEDQLGHVDYVSITNSKFENCNICILFEVKNVQLSPPLISNCNFNNCCEIAIELLRIPEINIEHNQIDLLPENVSGIFMLNNGNVNIYDCIITGAVNGIESNFRIVDEEFEINEELETNISITQCIFENCHAGILIDDQEAPYEAVNIYANHFDMCKYGITVNSFFEYSPYISENILSGRVDGTAECGILMTNGNEAVALNNSITNFLTGINLNLVNTPHIISNFISAVDLTVDPGPGILFVSSDGEMRKNIIQYHSNGIELGSSSSKLAENTITNNDFFGIYVGSGSYPNLGLTISGPETYYPLTGYNEIRENGKCGNDNSEIYFSESAADLESGCNIIADDRENDPGLGCDYTLLMDGVGAGEIFAMENYWGDHPVYGHDPAGRFGNELYVEYDPYYEEPCVYSPGEGFLILSTSDGTVFDTVYSSGVVTSALTDLQSRYATANNYYYSLSYQAAKQEYNVIIQNYENSRASIQAYTRLYEITKLINGPPETFNQLKEFYLQKVSNQTDSIMIEALTHLSDLCLVSATEYFTAINNFDQTVQQNPNTDIAFYREIDALTTSLMIEDSTMLKGSFVKYCVSGISDYTDRLSRLIKNRGLDVEWSEKEIIPTVYTLYQNYPNPFNPITTIKYDLPNASEVSLIIYDILGRRVKTLVNDKQQSGKYEIQFDASSLASGVYLYQIVAEDFIRTKKMILLK